MIYRVKIRDFWYADNATGKPINFKSWAAANDIACVSLNEGIPAEVINYGAVKFGAKREKDSAN